jgi:hypothetical protein
VKWRPVVEFAHTHPRRQLPRTASSSSVACYREVLADSEEATTGNVATDTTNSTNNKENASGFTMSAFSSSSSSSAMTSQKFALLQQGSKSTAARNQRQPQTVSTAAKGMRSFNTATTGSATAAAAGGKKQRSAAPAAAALATAAAAVAAAAAAVADITFVTSLPDALPCEPADAAKPEARAGVGLLTWSHDSRYLATRSDVSPAVLWVWDASTLQLVAAVQFARAVLALRWCPTAACLAVATGARRVYLWQPEPHGVGWLDAPCSSSSGSSSSSMNDSVTGEPQPVFRVLDVRWHPAGDSLVMLSRDRMIGVRLEQQAEVEGSVIGEGNNGSSGAVAEGDDFKAGTAALAVA